MWLFMPRAVVLVPVLRTPMLFSVLLLEFGPVADTLGPDCAVGAVASGVALFALGAVVAATGQPVGRSGADGATTLVEKNFPEAGLYAHSVMVQVPAWQS
jgi:hypothetical protein